MSTNMLEIKEGAEESGLIPACKINVERFFIDQYGAKKLLADIKKMAYSFGQDVTTDDGREIIRSTAYKIARSRTFIKSLGQDLVKKDKERVKKTNATIKLIEEETKKIQDEYRKPLTEFEEKEKREEEERKAKEKAKVEDRIRQLQEYRCVLPYGEVASMTDEEFEEVLAREKKIEEDRQAEADRVKKEQEELEKQKKEIREQKIQAITMRLTSFGMECQDNFFTFKIENFGAVFANMDELADLDMDELNHRLDEIAERIEMAKIVSEKSKEELPPEHEPEEKEEEKAIEADPVEVTTEASGTFTADTEKEESVLSQSIKGVIDADINIIHSWIDIIKSIASNPPAVSNPASMSVCEDVSHSFVEFFDKTKELVVAELR